MPSNNARTGVVVLVNQEALPSFPNQISGDHYSENLPLTQLPVIEHHHQNADPQEQQDCSQMEKGLTQQSSPDSWNEKHEKELNDAVAQEHGHQHQQTADQAPRKSSLKTETGPSNSEDVPPSSHTLSMNHDEESLEPPPSYSAAMEQGII